MQHYGNKLETSAHRIFKYSRSDENRANWIREEYPLLTQFELNIVW
jgi:hypothetical protein